VDKAPPPALPPWLEQMLPFERYLADIGEHRVHVMEAGAGRPVLMLHGNPTWGFLYRKVAAELKGEPLRLVMPDLVGLGLSDKPRALAAHTLENHGRWMAALIERLDLRELVFVGQDWGGPIGLWALAKTGRMAGLVLMNTVAGPPRPDFRPTRFHRFARRPLVSDVAFRLLEFPQRQLSAVQGDKASISGDVARAYRFPLRRLADRAAPLALARMVPDSLQHPSVAPLGACQSFVERFEGPSAIVWGDRDPVLGKARGGVEKLLPRAEVTRTGAGHFLQEEVPGEIAKAIRGVAGKLGAA
jgi:haloalkane dehalogenase